MVAYPANLLATARHFTTSLLFAAPEGWSRSVVAGDYLPWPILQGTLGEVKIENLHVL